MERSKEAYPDTLFFNIDAMDMDNRALLMNDLNINTVPSFRIFVNGEMTASVNGGNNFDQVEIALKEAIEKHNGDDEIVTDDTTDEAPADESVSDEGLTIIDDTEVSDDTMNVVDDTEVADEAEEEPLGLAQTFAKRFGIQQRLAALF